MRLAWRIATGLGIVASLSGVWSAASSAHRRQLGIDLLDATQRGDPTTVRVLLNSGADPETRSEYSATAIHHAEAADDPDSVMLLAEHGADINARDRSGRTALQRAAIRGDLQMVMLFVELDVNLENADITGRTALNSAASGGHPLVVETLLKAGAATEAVDRRGMTALHMAAGNRHERVVEILLKHGANPRPPSRGGLTPVISALRRHSGTSPFDRFQPTGAAEPEAGFGRDGRPGLSRILRLLARYGADLTSRDFEGHSVLELCVGQVDGSTVDQLRRRRAAGNEEANLLLALWLNRPEEARAALNRGASANARTAWGESAVWLAACLRRTSIAEILLQRGANPDLGRGGLSTPLVIAAGQGDEPMVRLLLRHRARVNSTHPSPIERLQSPLLAAINGGHPQVARLLLQTGADVNQSDWGGHTPLMTAAAQGDAQIVRLLLDAGAHVNTATEGGDTALRRACLSEQLDVVRLLLERGADPTIRNEQDHSLIQQIDIYRGTAGQHGRSRARIVTLLRRALERWTPSPHSRASHQAG